MVIHVMIFCVYMYILKKRKFMKGEFNLDNEEPDVEIRGTKMRREHRQTGEGRTFN